MTWFFVKQDPFETYQTGEFLPQFSKMDFGIDHKFACTFVGEIMTAPQWERCTHLLGQFSRDRL